jgi:ketosteroid isomerase-like protein
MRTVMIAMAVAVLMSGPLLAAEKDDVLAVVKQCNDAFNKGDMNAALAFCTDEMSIIDPIPPYEWHGPGAFAKWFADYDVNAKKTGMTDGAVTIGKTKHVDIDGDRAYVVVTATFNYKLKGKPTKQAASWTFSLLKTKDGWRITGWAWSKS